MNPWKSLIFTLNIVVLWSLFVPTNSFAQDSNDNENEVYLEFRHRGVIGSVVVSFYKENEFYLPVTELFSLFKIDHSVNGLIIDGRFGLEQTPYEINLQEEIQQIRFGDKTIDLSQNDYLIKEIDLYLRADLFFEAFGLNFSIDFNNLTLNLQTEKELPAIAEALRKQRRRLADENRYQDIKYDLRFDRERPFLDGGFLDYNLSANLNSSQNVYNANTNLGIQLYGGDLQGSLFGSYSENFTNFSTDNLRWRYMYRDQPWLTKLTIGQSTSDGIARNAYTGIRLSNEPIEPRQLFDEFVVQGSTIPEAEVELYMNNSLIDFQEADEMGNYRFLTPITYGSSQLDLKIYGPTGQIIERSSRIQVPFTFQPKGVFNYNLNFGRLDNPIIGSTEQNLIAQGSGAYGITDWLTAKTGVEYYEGLNDNLPTFTSSLSSRILSNYILTFEAATESYYRGVFNSIFPNSASINIDYTDYIGDFSIYNPSNDDKRLVGSVFYPFNIFDNSFNLRASTFSRIREGSSSTTIRFDANSRIGKTNLRVAYSDRISGRVNLLEPTNTSYIESSATYNISRNRNLPPYLRGVFLRAQLRYRPTLKEFDSAEFLVSRTLFHQGRFQLSAGRNFRGDFNTLRFSLVVDFNKVRTNTTFNNIRTTNSFTQNIRGSVGYDSNYDNFLFTSRNQVGRAGVAIKLYVDNDGDREFDDGDNTIETNAVRVQRSGANSTIKNGILYFTQMQPYFYYNMEMNKATLENPLLVPEFDKFGLISDPNRFKKVEIPFYMSGVIEGVVKRQLSNNSKTGIGGLKVLLNQTNGDFNKELRTFSDGNFYDYEVPPGEYELKVDSSQLEILNSRSIPEKLEFDIEALPEGDFVEGLSFLLVPVEMTREEVEQIADASETAAQPESNTEGDGKATENAAVPDTSSTLAENAGQITESVTDTLSNEEQIADQGDDQQTVADQDDVNTGLPPVIPPIIPPNLPIGGLTELDADSARTDSLTNLTVSEPIADASDEPVQIPDSSTTELRDVSDIPADSTIAVIDENIGIKDEGLVQPEDSLGAEPDVVFEGGILPPVITPVIPPNLTAMDLTKPEADSSQTDSLPDATDLEQIADVIDEPIQIPDSTFTEVHDTSAIPSDSTVAVIDENIGIKDEGLIQPEDSLAAEPALVNTGGLIPPVVTAPGLANRDSAKITLPVNSTGLDKDNEGIAVALPPVQNATDFIPSAFSSTEDFESLTPGSCIYGIQFASYSKESQADNLSRRLEEDYLVFTIYNTPYDLYALRELQYQSLARVTSATKELNTSYDFDAAVISQCYADLDLNPEMASYYIKIAEFATTEAAQVYLRDLKDAKGITAAEIPGDVLGTNIGIGPFRSERQAARRLKELSGDFDNSANFIISRYVPPVKVADLSFEFILLLDEFSSEEQAINFAGEMENVHSLNAKILQDENKEIYMVTSELTKDWSRINNLKDRVLSTGISEEPVILMIEKKN